MTNSGPSFFVKSSDNAFTDRQKNIFDQLNLIEKEKKQNSPEDNFGSEEGSECADRSAYVTTASLRKKRRETKQFRGKESIFKRPERLPPRFKVRDLPDYQRHPNKWTKYSLADVSNDDMSERSNTATAMAFLKELESRRNDVQSTEAETRTKIEFKPKRKINDISIELNESGSSTQEEKGSFKHSKLVMPEYVVGRGKKKEVKRASKSSDDTDKRHKEIKLSHLDEEDE